ncbi:hypothetical protein Tco_0227419 [Tanacetum coccineum]
MPDIGGESIGPLHKIMYWTGNAEGTTGTTWDTEIIEEITKAKKKFDQIALLKRWLEKCPEEWEAEEERKRANGGECN